jgi:3-oxoacyl-[acyl-carrier-protein] synthase III
MFTAMLLACSIYLPTNCVQFDDTRGPYKTEDECIVRLAEMIGTIREISPELVVRATRCATDVGEQT